METIFDHDPSSSELIELLGEAIPKAEYLRFAGDADTENGRIYRLFTLRGDDATAAEFLARIDDPLYRYNVALVDVH